jgi:hypothetical protein
MEVTKQSKAFLIQLLVFSDSVRSMGPFSFPFQGDACGPLGRILTERPFSRLAFFQIIPIVNPTGNFTCPLWCQGAKKPPVRPSAR